jgi:hypothetical protein
MKPKKKFRKNTPRGREKEFFFSNDQWSKVFCLSRVVHPVSTCWRVDGYVDVLTCKLTCWCVEVSMCWWDYCVGVLTIVLKCWCVDDCVDNYVDVLLMLCRWRWVDVRLDVHVDVHDCVGVWMCWRVDQ